MTLQELIQQRCADQGWSYGDVARQSATADFPDGKISRSTVQKLASTTRLRVTPDPDILESLARGLGQSLAVVQLAAAASVGIVLEELAGLPDDIQVVVASMRDMDDDERARIRRVVEALRTE